MAMLSKKQRAALPFGLPQSAHLKLLEKCGILGLYHLVHPDGDREKIDGLRQYADCQTNLIAQTDLFYHFREMVEAEDGNIEEILNALADFCNEHDKGLKITQLRTMEDVIGQKQWDEALVTFCQALAQKEPEAYRINLLCFAQNTDVTLSKDVLGAIGNWTVDYNWAVYADEDFGKPKDKVILQACRAYLKREASELARAYTLERLWKHTSEKYRKDTSGDKLRPWDDIADQVHALLPLITGSVQQEVKQQDGSIDIFEVTVGALLLEVLAWYIVTCREGRSIVYNVRCREMTPAPQLATEESTSSLAELEMEEENERAESARADKLYRSAGVFTLIAVPNEDRTNFVFRENWDVETGNLPMGHVEVIHYVDAGQQGSGLSSADIDEFKKALNDTDPLLLILPTCVAHPPHTGLVTGRNSPKWSLYEEVSPPHQKLNVTRTSFQGLALGPHDPDRKQASLYDMVHYGVQLGQEFGHANTMEYTFPARDRPQCYTLRTEPIDAACRHMLMATPNEARRHAKTIMEIQKRIDETGAVVGGYAVKINGVILPVMSKEAGDKLTLVKTRRLEEYKKLMTENGVLARLAEPSQI